VTTGASGPVVAYEWVGKMQQGFKDGIGMEGAYTATSIVGAEMVESDYVFCSKEKSTKTKKEQILGRYEREDRASINVGVLY